VALGASNVFVERLWRSVKYERVHLKAYDRVSAVHADIADYLGWYNASPAHPRLGDIAPDDTTTPTCQHTPG
jgi:putative transposase